MLACVIPNMRQIIWSAALKQKGSGPVYSQRKARRENDTMELSSIFNTALWKGGGWVKVVN